jgi:hypothetical protein
MKKSSTSLAIKEMHIKTTLRFHFLQSEWLSPKKQATINAGEDTGKKEPLSTAGGNVN